MGHSKLSSAKHAFAVTAIHSDVDDCAKEMWGAGKAPLQPRPAGEAGCPKRQRECHCMADEGAWPFVAPPLPTDASSRSVRRRTSVGRSQQTDCVRSGVGARDNMAALAAVKTESDRHGGNAADLHRLFNRQMDDDLHVAEGQKGKKPSGRAEWVDGCTSCEDGLCSELSPSNITEKRLPLGVLPCADSEATTTMTSHVCMKKLPFPHRPSVRGSGSCCSSRRRNGET